MSSLAHRPVAFSVDLGDRRAAQHAAQRSARGSLILRATEDGWALLDSQGHLLYHALGIQGRHRCLEFAREHGVLAVFS